MSLWRTSSYRLLSQKAVIVSLESKQLLASESDGSNCLLGKSSYRPLSQKAVTVSLESKQLLVSESEGSNCLFGEQAVTGF